MTSSATRRASASSPGGRSAAGVRTRPRRYSAARRLSARRTARRGRPPRARRPSSGTARQQARNGRSVFSWWSRASARAVDVRARLPSSGPGSSNPPPCRGRRRGRRRRRPAARAAWGRGRVAHRRRRPHRRRSRLPPRGAGGVGAARRAAAAVARRAGSAIALLTRLPGPEPVGDQPDELVAEHARPAGRDRARARRLSAASRPSALDRSPPRARARPRSARPARPRPSSRVIASAPSSGTTSAGSRPAGSRHDPEVDHRRAAPGAPRLMRASIAPPAASGSRQNSTAGASWRSSSTCCAVSAVPIEQTALRHARLAQRDDVRVALDEHDRPRLRGRRAREVCA